ncbi:MAG: GNAT family N-acetyltransferase, partial [Bacteroidota bacterium]
MKKEAYIFKSERLGFRAWSAADLEAFAALNADEAVMEHFPKTLTQTEVERFIEKLNNHLTTNGFTYYATEILA